MSSLMNAFYSVKVKKEKKKKIKLTNQNVLFDLFIFFKKVMLFDYRFYTPGLSPKFSI